MKRKIIIGMSGGVDSSIAASLLQKQNWSPVGVSLKLPVWKSEKNLFRENACCTADSLKNAQKVCQKLKIPHYIFDVQSDFRKKVINYFISETKDLKTPNPCVICNRYLKFASLFQFAKNKKIKYIATGHYARTGKNETTNEWELLKARDKNKDQTYALSFLTQNQLKYIVFPLGKYTKQKVYLMAQKEGFDFFLKTKQSQDFCFVAGKSLPLFLEEKIGVHPGKIIDSKNNVLGKHRGLHFFTIGQRKGLKLSGGPWFVKELSFKNNSLVVTKNAQSNAQKEISLAPFNFISNNPLKEKIKITAKIRSRQSLSQATLFPPKKGKLKLVFEKKQKAVTPGQFAVFYQKNICLGGGRILS